MFTGGFKEWEWSNGNKIHVYLIKCNLGMKIKYVGPTQFENGSEFSHDLIMLWANQLIVDWLINKKIKKLNLNHTLSLKNKNINTS